MFSIEDFPNEILQAIVDENRHDIVTLSALSLTSRRMHSCAVRPLFARIRLSCPTDFPLFIAMTRTTAELATSIVKEIIFRPRLCNKMWLGPALDLLERHLISVSRDLDNASRTSAALPSVRKLVWNTVWYSHNDASPETSRLISLFPFLVELDLVEATFFKVSQFEKFVSMLPPLKILRIQKLRFCLLSSPDDQTMSRTCDLSKLEALEVDHWQSSCGPFILELLKRSTLSALRSLKLKSNRTKRYRLGVPMHGPMTVADLAYVLSASSRTLEELVVDDAADLSSLPVPLPKLKSITITGVTDGNDGVCYAFLTSQNSYPLLKTITLVFESGREKSVLLI